jgi:hypothetical protein
VQQLVKRTYPRDHRGPGNLSACYFLLGQFQQADVEAEEALRLNPPNVAWHENLGRDFVGLNRFAEARETFERALQQKLDSTIFHTSLYAIAFVNGDTPAQQQQLDWARGKPDEYVALDWQTGAAAFAGQWKQSQDFARRAIDLATRSGAKEVAARYAAEAALRAAALKQCAQTQAFATQALALERNQVTLTRAALALALCGAAARTQLLVDELLKRYPKNTIVNGLWLPTIRAALLLQGELPRNAEAAIEQLQAALRYEAAGEFWPQYVRGQAHLKLNQPAAAEFQKILDHRGQAPLSVLYPLAQPGLARTATLSGDVAKARRAYQDFIALWQDADADLAALSEAKKELAKLP